MPKLWQVAQNKGMVTPADYVRERFDSFFLALLVAVTGFIATMPYIALQMVGIEIVLFAMGVPITISLVVAFATVGTFMFVSGLRAPALIALVKDFLIYTMTLVAVIYIPIKLGGYGEIFNEIPNSMLTFSPEQYSAYASLALGSALALFLYPHAVTAVFGSSSARWSSATLHCCRPTPFSSVL